MKNQIAIWVAALLGSVAMTPINIWAFDSGSDGSYGALNITNIGTNYVTMPADGIFRCTTINVATNCVLKFTNNALNTPVYLLAQSNIVIDGVIDVSGQDGQTNGNAPTIPGPGGFSGGPAGTASLSNGSGQGPGAGQHDTHYGFGGSFGSLGYYSGNNSSSIYGNHLLVPLIGGSGGGGSLFYGASTVDASGGAGGGAVLLASSVCVTNRGVIRAKGGNGINHTYYSGGGSGGGVRIIAPVVSITGSIDVSGGTNSILSSQGYGGNGRVRIDTASTGLNAKVISNTQAGASVVSYGRSMFVFPPASPQLYFLTVAGTNIVSGTNNNVTLGGSSPTNQVVTLCGTNFLGTVPVQIVATPDYGTPFTTNISMVFPAQNVLVTTNVTINVPYGISTKLNAYADYGVQP